MQFEICKSFKGHSNNRLNNEVDRLAVNAKNTARKTGKQLDLMEKHHYLEPNRCKLRIMVTIIIFNFLFFN